MTYLKKVKYMPLSTYTTSVDSTDSICAVDAPLLFSTGLFPDWSKVVTMSLNTTYTVGSGVLSNYTAGYVWCGSNNWNGSWCGINGVSFVAGGWFTEDGHDRKLLFFPVSTGDYFSCTGGSHFLFIPITGGF